MTEDRIARMMALDAAQQGGTGDAYTKAETDALLDGKADLENGKVPAAQLPSYVDDVLEYASTSSFPATGESGKIYVATDTNRTYRWGGSAYVEISESLALGETASTAYAGDKGKANADAIAKKPGEITTGTQYVIGGRTVTAGTGAEAFNDLTNNKAAGQYSHAEGYFTTARGDCGHAEGYYTTASGKYSHAEGDSTSAYSDSCHAEGCGTSVSGKYSHAEGYYAKAYSNYSHAEGYNTTASSANQHVQGKYNVADVNNTYAFIIGNGTSDNNRHNAFAIDWNGLIYVNGAATGVDVSTLAPQSTTYTKSEVDTALSAKLNTADVDDALSGTSTNPVQNKAVQAPVARLVDAGAKNLLYIYDQNAEAQGISYVVKDGIVSASGTANGKPSSRANLESALLPPGEYIFSGCPANGSDTTYRVDLYTSTDDTSYSLDNNMIDRGTGVVFTLSTQMYVRPTIRFQNGYVASNLVFKPMLCTAEDYAISPEFVPYTPTMRELYEMILALQNAQNGG